MDYKAANTAPQTKSEVYHLKILHTWYAHCIPLVDVGKERCIKNRSIVKPEEAAPVTRTTLRTTGPVPVDSRQ